MLKRPAKIFLTAALIVVTLFATPVSSSWAQTVPQQGESFADPTYRDMVQTFLLMQGLDISNPKIADEYARLSYCSLYSQKYHNDFEWNKIRAEIVTRASQKRDYFRVQYQLEGTFYLGRFDFQTQQFPYIKDSALNHVGSFIAIGDVKGGDDKGQPYRLCNGDFSKIFPSVYAFDISSPFTMTGLKVSQDDAKALLDKMASVGNTDRRIYVRFRYRVQTVDKLDPFGGHFDIRNTAGILHVEMTSVDLFLDRDLTKFYMSVPLK